MVEKNKMEYNCRNAKDNTLIKCYKSITINLYLAKTNKNKEDDIMCFNFNRCSELFTSICKYFNLGC